MPPTILTSIPEASKNDPVNLETLTKATAGTIYFILTYHVLAVLEVS